MRSVKNSIEIKIRVTPEHLQKLNSTGIRNKSEVIRRCIDSAIPSCYRLIFRNEVFAQYEYKGWIITIDKSHSGFNGFATPKKYCDILTIYNYWDIDDIAQENGIEIIEEENNGDYHYSDKDFNYVVAECDDVVVTFLSKVDVTNIDSVLNYVITLINDEL